MREEKGRYIDYVISGRTDEEKEKDRAYRTKDNIMTRGCSFPFTHFGTITTKNIELTNDVKRFIAIIKRELNKQGLKFIIVAEPYRDEIHYDYWKEKERHYDDYIHMESPYREGFHAHILTDGAIDFTPFIEKYESDPSNLYCEPIYTHSNVYKAMRYITKFVDYTKSMVEKGTHIYTANTRKVKPRRTLTIKDDEINETKIIRENKHEKSNKETREKTDNLYKKIKEEQIKAYRYQLLHGFNTDNLIPSSCIYGLNAYKGGYIPYGFIPFNGTIYSLYGDYNEKDVLIHGLCSPITYAITYVHQPVYAHQPVSCPMPARSGAIAVPSLCPCLCFKCKKTRLIVGSQSNTVNKGVIKSHTGTNGVPMPLYKAFLHKINVKKSDTGLKGSPIPFSKRLFVPMPSEFMRYIVYVAHIPDG